MCCRDGSCSFGRGLVLIADVSSDELAYAGRCKQLIPDRNRNVWVRTEFARLPLQVEGSVLVAYCAYCGGVHLDHVSHWNIVFLPHD